MNNMRCQLTSENAISATTVAMLQILRKVHNGGRDGDHGSRSGRRLRLRIADGIIGMLGEIACSRILNLAWEPGGKEISNVEIGGVLEARATEYEDGHLPLYDRDDDKSVFAFLIVTYPSASIAGFIVGLDGKDQKFWDTTRDPPCFWIPQSALVASLPIAVDRLKRLWPDLPEAPMHLMSTARR